MVADLTRYRACKVHADTPEKPVRLRRADESAAPEQGRLSEQKVPTGGEPVRLFAWVSA